MPHASNEPPGTQTSSATACRWNGSTRPEIAHEKKALLSFRATTSESRGLLSDYPVAPFHTRTSRADRGRLPPRLNAPLPALGLPSSPASDTDIGHTHSASKNELSPRYKDNDVSTQGRYTTRPTHGFDSNTRPEICRMLLRAVTDQSHRPPVISARETRRPSSPLQSTDPTRRLPRDLRRPN